MSPATQQSLQRAIEHHTAGRYGEAEQIYQQILQADPDQPIALHLLGVLAHQTGNSAAAVDLIRKAIAIKPDFVEAHNNLGLALRKLGSLEGAVESYGKAIAINPDFAMAHSNLGNALKEQGKLDQALASFHAALSINPEYAEAHNNLGLVLLSLGKTEQAADSFHKALAINPNYGEAHNNLGLALHSSGQLEQAVSSYHKAIALKPDYAEAHNNLGNALKELARLDDAVGAYRQALRIQPDDEHAAVNLLHQLHHACAWSEIDGLESKVKEFTRRSIDQGNPVTMSPLGNVTSTADGAENLAVARSKSREIASKMSAFKADFKFPAASPAKSPITIGYLSSDFQNHATAHLMLSLFELHNRDQFKVFTFSHGRNESSPYRAKIVGDSDSFFDLRHDDHLQGAEKIFQSGVDILVDLKGHTQNNRLEICALRPAPVQVSYLGFPGTSGADFIDYLITDPTVTPQDQAPYFSEQLVYLPHCYQINDRQQKISDISFSRSDFGLPDKGFVFCSFNGNYKIEPVMFDVWMALLKKVPDSVLWLYRSNDLAEANLKLQAQARGVEAERLIFTGKMPKDQHLVRYQLADLALDTRICGGHTTTSDALWAGVPVITMMGAHFASRVSASLLKAVGLPELISQNLQQYEALAYGLSQNPAQLADLKAKLSRNRLSEPLFDTPRFVKNLETAYRTMWDKYLSGEAAARIDVIE